jgi:hypothetical protein
LFPVLAWKSLEQAWRRPSRSGNVYFGVLALRTGCDISYGMESTTGSRSVSPGWRLLVLLPLAAGVVLGVLSAKQTGAHAEIELLTIATLFVNAALIALGVYWIVVKKLTGLGVLMLIVSSTVVGFGLHTLLRML